MSRTKETQSEKKTLQAVLTLSGLGEKESKLYTILLQEGIIPASVLITKSGLKKGNTYAVLHQLQEKNLVRTFTKDKKQYFQPEPPQNVLEMLQKRSEETKLATQYFEHILPDLSSQYKKSISKPVVRYFEGDEGIVKVFEDIYNVHNEYVTGCLDIEESNISFPNYVVKKLIPSRIKNGLHVSAILGDSPQSRELAKKDNEQLRDTVLVDKKRYPFPAEIDVYNDKIAMMSFKKGDFVAVILENEAMATSLMSLFRLIHDLLGKKKED